jgi:hypothetical protein
VRLSIGQRPEQQGIDDAEHRGIAADAGCKRHDRNGREAGISCQHA